MEEPTPPMQEEDRFIFTPSVHSDMNHEEFYEHLQQDIDSLITLDEEKKLSGKWRQFRYNIKMFKDGFARSIKKIHQRYMKDIRKQEDKVFALEQKLRHAERFLEELHQLEREKLQSYTKGMWLRYEQLLPS
jgi:predicted RNase H-like nuclease (RuvC/YqgF family)